MRHKVGFSDTSEIMVKIKKVFMLCLVFAALLAMCTVVKAEEKTNIRYIYIQSDIDDISNFAAVNGQELPEPNFSLAGAEPAAADCKQQRI